MKPSEFFRRWGEGIKNLTPRQQVGGRIVGTWGSIVGLILAWVVLLSRGVWYFSVVLFFAIFLQVIGLIGSYQQYREQIKVESQMQTSLDDLKKQLEQEVK